MNIFIGNYDIEKREYIACHANISNDLTDEQLEKLFTLGFEFVDYTVTASSKLAAIVKISDGIKGHKIDSWN